MRGVPDGYHVARTELMNRPRRPDRGWTKEDAILLVLVLQRDLALPLTEAHRFARRVSSRRNPTRRFTSAKDTRFLSLRI
jgi:hypothetical protein